MRRLLLAHLTLLHVAPPVLVSNAAAAGYDGVSLHVSQTPPGSDDGLKYEARKHRQFPGEGGLPLVPFLRAFAPGMALSVETPVSEWHDRLDATAIAERSSATTRALLASMGESVVPDRQGVMT